MSVLDRLRKEEEGQDLIEYALVVALLALSVAAVLPALATAIVTAFNGAVTVLNNP
jgi:pilus assembly protein Flp/PilA